MKIGIIGAGNVGTAMAALIGGHGGEVTLVARGARLQRIGAEGVALNDRGQEHRARVKAVPALDQPMDAVFLCTKAQDLPAALAANAAGIAPQTLVIPMINGLPFWFALDSPELARFVDPQGTLARLLRRDQVLGAVLLMTIRQDEAGRAMSTNTPTLSLGPVAAGGDDAKRAALLALLNRSGIAASQPEDIRHSVLVKLLANIATNPLSALLGCNLSRIGQDADLRALSFAVADEFRAWAATLGHDLPDNDWLGALLLDAGDFPTSMLQDARAGRPLELAAICHAPMALAKATGLAMPCLSGIVARLESAATLPLPEAARPACLQTCLDALCAPLDERM